jgi:hypothetical protein
MNRKFARLVPSGVLTLFVASTAGLAQAGPNVLPPGSNAHGGYAELAAAWMEWAFGIPAAMNPLFDTDGSDAAVGQSGKVWFLAGTVRNEDSPVTREITVPSGTALFFPVVNSFWINVPSLGDNEWSEVQEAFARACIKPWIDSAQNVVLEIDGVAVNVWDLRFPSAVGDFDVPDGDIFTAVFGVDVPTGRYPCVADGYWALVPPLSVGEHTIRFAGALAANGYMLDVTYHVIVKPRRKVATSAK